MIPIIYFHELGSTQDKAWELGGRLGVELAVVAGSQRRGRGRCGRVWASPPGGLYLSIYLRRRMPAEHACRLQYYAAVAVAEVVGDLCGGVGIRWPNDILAGGGKVAGILVENMVVGGEVSSSVIGVGMNLNNEPPVPGSSSIRGILGRRVDAARVLDLTIRRVMEALTLPWADVLGRANRLLVRRRGVFGCEGVEAEPIRILGNCCLEAVSGGRVVELCV